MREKKGQEGEGPFAGSKYFPDFVSEARQPKSSPSLMKTLRREEEA
jgi:hypothetical protein